MLLSIICALRKEAGPPPATLVSSTQRTICKQQVPGVAIRLQPIVAVRRRSCSVYNICGVMPRRTCKRFEIRDATYKLKLRVSNIRTYSVIVTRVSPRESVWGGCEFSHRINDAKFLLVFHINYGSVLLTFRDMITDGRPTDDGNRCIYIWPLLLN